MRLSSVPDAVYPTAAFPVDEAVGTVSVAAGASTAASEALSAEDRHTPAAAGDACTWK